MFAVSRLNGLPFTLMSVTVHGVKTGLPSGNTPCFLRASRGIVGLYHPPSSPYHPSQNAWRVT